VAVDADRITADNTVERQNGHSRNRQRIAARFRYAVALMRLLHLTRWLTWGLQNIQLVSKSTNP